MYMQDVEEEEKKTEAKKWLFREGFFRNYMSIYHWFCGCTELSSAPFPIFSVPFKLVIHDSSFHDNRQKVEGNSARDS